MHQQMRRHANGSRCCRFVTLLALSVGLGSLTGGLAVSPASAAPLPDGRAYELVSPPDLQGASLWTEREDSLPLLPEIWSAVSSDGSSVIWRILTGGGTNSNGLADTYRSVRGPDTWESKFAGPPSGVGVPTVPVLQFATPNLDRLLWLTGNLKIDPSDHDPVETATSDGQWRDLYSVGSDGALVHFNRGPVEVPAAGEDPRYLGASQDLAKVVFDTDRQLTSDATGGGGIYWSDGHTTKLVSKDENGLAMGRGALDEASKGSSADASVVVFASNGRENLYIWSAQSGTTKKAISSLPLFDLVVDSVSADGKRIFLTASTALTADDTDTSRDLYVYNNDDDPATPDIKLLSAPGGGSSAGNSDACAAPLPNANQCDVAPVVETRDGSEAYFISPEKLVPGQGVEGGPNLYLNAHSAIRFVATLDSGDPVFDANVGNAKGIRARHVRLSPDGKKLIFESRAALTNYNNAGFKEIYVYDSISQTLACASCRVNGTPPTGDSALSSVPGGRPEAPQIGYELPMGTANSDEHGERVFFNSADAIVSDDVNGRNDVYQYTALTKTPALISSGRSERDSGYVGNGIDGRDVFFLTTDTLVSQDLNGSVFKMYDARIDGVTQPKAGAPSCEGAGCRLDEAAPPPAPQGSGRVTPRTQRPQSLPAPTASRVVVSGSRSVKGVSLRLAAKVSGAGRLSVTGRGLVKVSRKTSRATTYHLAVRLSKASAAKLRRAHRLVVSATVRFVPSKGTTRSVKARLTFTAPSNRNAR